MPKLLVEVETFLKSEVTAVEADLEAGWVELKPAISALGKTILGQVLAAAESLVMNPTSVGFAAALASVVAQLPADATVLETAIAGAISTKVAQLKAAPVVTPAAS